jgi:hypothetical protein
MRSCSSPNSLLAFSPFATLPNLYHLAMRSLSGDPTWMWQLTQLKTLDLFDPLFPLNVNSIGNLVNMETLGIWADIRSPLPSSVASWTRLRNLQLTQSAGSGKLPDVMANLTSLETISVQGYDIPPGVLPDIATYPNLTSLYLASISTMTSPPSLVGANKLELLSLIACSSLTRFPAIPDGGLPNLRSVLFYQLTSITEPLPIGYYNSLSMSAFAMNGIPSSEPMSPLIGRWAKIRQLSYQDVPLTGTIPTSITSLRNLTALFLKSVPISGSIVALDGMPSLQSLAVSNTQISDFIFNISSTPLTQLCVQIALIYCCVRFQLTANASKIILPECWFKTSFPPWISQATSLYTLEFSSNGILPQPFPDLTSLTNLLSLTISSENFIGELPNIFDALQNLQVLTLRNNGLNGTIPPSVFSGPGQVDVSFNRFNAFPASMVRNCTFNTLYAYNNSLVGPSIASLASCSHAGVIDLSNNLLGPLLPASLLNLPRLFTFSLRHNQYSAIAFLPPIQQPAKIPLVVDFSENRFSGPIDDTLLTTMIQYGGRWYVTFASDALRLHSLFTNPHPSCRIFNDNTMECPRYNFTATLASWIDSPNQMYSVYVHESAPLLQYAFNIEVP